jgi:hypothetical protein
MGENLCQPATYLIRDFADFLSWVFQVELTLLVSAHGLQHKAKQVLWIQP